MIYGYARVSTIGQSQKGTSLEDQERQLREKGYASSVFKEAYTGTTTDRPQFQKLLETMKSGDRLVVTKLDRFSRTAVEGMKIIDDLLDRGIEVHVLNMGLMDDSSTGKLIRAVLLAFAEFERDMIFERTQAGKERKRATGELQEGRPQIEIPKFDQYKEAVQNGHMSVSKACKALGISRQTWYRRIAE